VRINMELVIRFDYGSVIPWVRRTQSGISAIAGPDMLSLRTQVPLRGENFKTESGASTQTCDGPNAIALNSIQFNPTLPKPDRRARVQ
jgi:hypothetical protein